MIRKIKVCMIVHAYYLKDARVQRYAEMLASLKYDVDVLCLREGFEPQRMKYNGVSIYRINLSRHRGGIISYIFEYSISFFKFFFLLNNLYWLKGKKYNTIHVHNFPNFLVFTGVFQKIFGVKVILDVHDPMPELFMSKFCISKSHPLIRFLELEEKLSLNYADFVIVANDYFRELIQKRGCSPKKIAVILNLPDQSFFITHINENEPHVDREHFEIIYIGTIAKRYGLDILIDAVAKIKNSGKIPNFRLTFIPKLNNEGKYMHELFQKIHSHGLIDCIRLLRPIPHKNMPVVIQNSHLSVYTPLPDVHMDVALSLKIPEVIAIGKPLVTSRISVLQKYFGEESILMFEPGNASDCADKIIQIYEHPAEASLRVQRARQKLEQYSRDNQKQTYLKIMENIL